MITDLRTPLARDKLTIFTVIILSTAAPLFLISVEPLCCRGPETPARTRLHAEGHAPPEQFPKEDAREVVGYLLIKSIIPSEQR